MVFNSIYSKAQELPLGYIKYYQNNCASSKLQENLVQFPKGSWNINQKAGYGILSATAADSLSIFPTCQCIISDIILGEYILEFEFKALAQQPNDSAGFYYMSTVKSCDTYYTFGFGKDSLTFYYSNKGVLSRIQSQKLDVETREWTKVRIVRDMLNRTIKLTLKGNLTQSFIFTDRKLVMGYFGFGTQNVNSGIRNITLWAPTAINDQIFGCE